jgi:hypothetical protein
MYKRQSYIVCHSYLIYTSQQKKRYKDFFKIYFYVKTKTIVYYHLRQCLCETRLSSQNKQ